MSWEWEQRRIRQEQTMLRWGGMVRLEEERIARVEKERKEAFIRKRMMEHGDAIIYYTMSYFPRLTDEMVTRMPEMRKSVYGDKLRAPKEYYVQDSTEVSLVLEWENSLITPKQRPLVICNYLIGIIFSPDGTINIKAGEHGTSSLSFNQIENNLSIQQGALERACLNPRSFLIRSRT